MKFSNAAFSPLLAIGLNEFGRRCWGAENAFPKCVLNK